MSGFFYVPYTICIFRKLLNFKTKTKRNEKDLATYCSCYDVVCIMQ